MSIHCQLAYYCDSTMSVASIMLAIFGVTNDISSHTCTIQFVPFEVDIKLLVPGNIFTL